MFFLWEIPREVPGVEAEASNRTSERKRCIFSKGLGGVRGEWCPAREASERAYFPRDPSPQPQNCQQRLLKSGNVTSVALLVKTEYRGGCVWWPGWAMWSRWPAQTQGHRDQGSPEEESPGLSGPPIKDSAVSPAGKLVRPGLSSSSQSGRLSWHLCYKK